LTATGHEDAAWVIAKEAEDENKTGDEEEVPPEDGVKRR
jgi:hypothetical protein